MQDLIERFISKHLLYFGKDISGIRHGAALKSRINRMGEISKR